MNTFHPRAVLGMVLFGAVAFLALLYFIGKGDTGPGPDNGEAHALGHGLNGYAGLVAMLQREGYDVSLSRSPARFKDESLLVLTPSAQADPEEIAKVIRARRSVGATLLILPKWFAVPAAASSTGARKGWVNLVAASAPGWADDLEYDQKMAVKVAALPASGVDWSGLELSGKLPTRRALALEEGGGWNTLVRDSQGRDLVAYADDGGCYPVLDAASGGTSANDCDERRWNLTVVFEPDLLNNYGLADGDRAALAARVVGLAREDQDLPVVFDLTFNGFGATRNLLTLAFQPPFLAATLSLMLALAVVAWRAFGRFGPPLSETREIAFGKARLAANSAAFIRRSGRLHLLGPPFAEVVARRIATVLGLRHSAPADIDRAIARREPDAARFTELAARLAAARGAAQTLRAAQALKELERTVTR